MASSPQYLRGRNLEGNKAFVDASLITGSVADLEQSVFDFLRGKGVKSYQSFMGTPVVWREREAPTAAGQGDMGIQSLAFNCSGLYSVEFGGLALPATWDLGKQKVEDFDYRAGVGTFKGKTPLIPASSIYQLKLMLRDSQQQLGESYTTIARTDRDKQLHIHENIPSAILFYVGHSVQMFMKKYGLTPDKNIQVSSIGRNFASTGLEIQLHPLSHDQKSYFWDPKNSSGWQSTSTPQYFRVAAKQIEHGFNPTPNEKFPSLPFELDPIMSIQLYHDGSTRREESR